MQHKTVSISIKSIEVDELIVPVVLWLNSFREVYTWWSCEGYTIEESDEKNAPQSPYVIFSCDSVGVARQIAKRVHGYGTVSFNYSLPEFPRFSLDFISKTHLYAFLENLKDSKVMPEFEEIPKTLVVRSSI